MRDATVLFVLLIVLSATGLAQVPRPGQPPPFPGQTQSPGEEDSNREKVERDAAKKANHDRQAALQRDTNKLLELATQLKQEVDKSSENTLSLDVVKKAEEIEKLAHSVREKMKGN